MPRIEHNIYEFFFGSKINDTGQDIVLYWSNGQEQRTRPGEHIYVCKQLEALEASRNPDTEIIFMGGALGGSKSHAGRSIVATRIIEWSRLRGKGMIEDKPFKGAIFSENYPVLKGRHIDPISAWPRWLGKYYKADKEFRFHEEFGGGIIRLLNLDQPAKYASDEYAIAFIDESTFNTEQTINDINARVRWPGLSDTLLILASNPGRVGHQYHRRRFVDPKTRDEGVVFIPSLLRDNPFLSLDPKYLKKLQRYPKKLVKAWVEGSWDQFEGQYFPDLNDEIHLVQPFRIPQEWLRFRVLDHGFKHPTACLWGAVDPEGCLYIYMSYEALETTADVNKRFIHELSADPMSNYGLPSSWRPNDKQKAERYVCTYGDPALKRIDGSAIGNKTPWDVYNAQDDGIGSFYVVEASRERVEGWQALQQAFHYEVDSEASERDQTIVYSKPPQIKIFDLPTHTAHYGVRSIHTGNALWEELGGLVYDERNTEDAAKSKGYYDVGEGDDSAECLRYFWTMVGRTDLSKIEISPIIQGSLIQSDLINVPFNDIKQRIADKTFF